MTIKTREPSDAFKKQVSDFVPVKKRRSWREEPETQTTIAESAVVDSAIVKNFNEESTIAKITVVDSNTDNRIEAIQKLTNTIYTIAKNTIADYTIEIQNDFNNLKDKNSSIEIKDTMVDSAIDMNLVNKLGATSIDESIVNSAIVDYSKDKYKHHDSNKVTTVLKSTRVNSAIANTTIAYSSVDNISNLNKVANLFKTPTAESTTAESTTAESAIADLTSVFSSAIKRIDNPSAIIIYLMLWTKATDKKIMISLNDLVNSVKLSKRTIQEALKKLQDLHFISKEQINPTSTPIYTLKMDCT